MCFHSILTKFRTFRYPCLQAYRTYSTKVIFDMNTVYFRHQNEEKQFQINFRYTNQGFGIDRVFNFVRSESEKIDTCLERIRTNVEKEFSKKCRKPKKKLIKGSDANEKQEPPTVCFTVERYFKL